MPYVTEIDADAELSAALNQFQVTCAANAAALSLTPANLTEIAGMATSFTTSFNAVVAVKQTAKSTVEAKDIQKKASKAILSKWAKTFRANQAVPDSLLDSLMLPHHKTPGTKTPPTQPTNLVASADGLGLVSLKWSRNGNNQRTQFLIETQTTPGGPWSVSGGTLKTKFQFQANVGEFIGFRVVASRDDQQSQASVPVQLWVNGGEGQMLTLAA